MSHCQLVVGDILAGGLFQIGDQVGEKEVLQLAAGLADQMAVRHGVAVVAVWLSGNGEAADLPVGGQLVEIAVNCAHGNVWHLLPGPKENFFSGEVVAYIGQNVTDQCLLFGHPATPFKSRIILDIIIP